MRYACLSPADSKVHVEKRLYVSGQLRLQGFVAKSLSRLNSDREILLMLITLFQATTTIFGDSVIARTRRPGPLQPQLRYLRAPRIFASYKRLRLRSSFPNCQDGAKNAGKRSDRQADRRSGPGKPESSSWPGLGQQRG